MFDLNAAGESPAWRIRATNRDIYIFLGLTAILALLPAFAGDGLLRLGVEFFTLVTMAQMWNLLAGYTGFVSVGQQVFVGLGAYGMALVATKMGINPFVAVAFAGVVAGVLGALVAPILFHLRGPYFAIGTWVFAELCRIFISNTDWLGGGSGLTLARAMKAVPRVWRAPMTFWLALGLMAISVLVVIGLLRSRFGLAIRTVRDNEASAESVGVNVLGVKLGVFIVAAFITGYAGAISYLNSMYVTSGAAFSVDWSALMIFVVVIGGIRTIEGPIIGVLFYFVLRELLADYGTWYLITLGLFAIALMMTIPEGFWGYISRKLYFKLFRTDVHLEVSVREHVPNNATAQGGYDEQHV